jgi:hypothetical protein
VQLLDTGASQAIRHAAAKQIAQLATKCVRAESGIEGDVNEVKPTLDANGSVVATQDRSEDWSEVISVIAKVGCCVTQATT